MAPRAVYLEEHEVVKAAVHHQPQGAGRHLSARTLLEVLGVCSLLLLMVLPLQPALLLPLFSSLPAAESTGQNDAAHVGNYMTPADSVASATKIKLQL